MIAGKGGGISNSPVSWQQAPALPTPGRRSCASTPTPATAVLEDPEFQRVSEAFKASNFNFKTLVRTLFSRRSSRGRAHQDRHRQRHGDQRRPSRTPVHGAVHWLGVTDACNVNSTKQTIYQDLSFGIPGSGYSRGSTSPLLPHDPDLFFIRRSRTCARSTRFDDRSDQDLHQQQGCYKSTDPVATNIDAFVATFMGLTANDERKADLTKILTTTTARR